MSKRILYFVLISIGYFVVTGAIYAIGYEYDKAHKLYPEAVQLSYDLSMGGVFGQRWVRFLEVAVALGVLVDVVIASIWFLSRPSKAANLELTTKD